MRHVIFLFCLLSVNAAQGGTFDAVGRLENLKGKGSCSAALIEANIVVTAAHCINEDSAADFGFRLGNGIIATPIPVKRAVLHPFYREFEDRKLRQLRFDIALVELALPVPENQAIPLKLGDVARMGEGLFLVSWRAQDGSRPRQRRCLVIEGNVSGVVTLGCRVRGGESGAPVLRLVPGGVELVAIVSSRSRLGRQPVAIASDVTLRIPPLLFRLSETP